MDKKTHKYEDGKILCNSVGDTNDWFKTTDNEQVTCERCQLLINTDKVTTEVEGKVKRLMGRLTFVSIVIGLAAGVHFSNVALAWLQTKEIRPMYVISKQDLSIKLQVPLRNKTPDDYKFHSPIPVVSVKEQKKHTPTATPTPKVESKKKTDSEIAAMIKNYDWDFSTAIRVAKSENFWNLTHSFECDRIPRNKDGSIHYNPDGSYDIGLFQINSIHKKTLEDKYGWTLEDMKDCDKNAYFAYDWLYKNQGWTPWSSYNNNSYLSHNEKI